MTADRESALGVDFDEVYAAELEYARQRWQTVYDCDNERPVATHRRELEVAAEAYDRLAPRLRELIENELPEIERALERAGAPWTPGRRPLP